MTDSMASLKTMIHFKVYDKICIRVYVASVACQLVAMSLNRF
jgi:hypothetical protein